MIRQREDRTSALCVDGKHRRCTGLLVSMVSDNERCVCACHRRKQEEPGEPVRLVLLLAVPSTEATPMP